jgi:hypothetical protein
MLKNQELYLYKCQSTGGYTEAIAATDTVDGTNLIEPLKESDISPEPAGDAVEIVAGNFDQDAWVPGAISAKGTLKFPMTPAFHTTPGSTNPGTISPSWGKCLNGMCGFAEAVSSGTKFAYTPVSVNTTAGLIKRYYGDTASSSSISDLFFNLKADWKIIFAANKYPTIEFSASGNFAAQTESESQPTVTKSRQTPYAFKGATISVLGKTLKIINGEIGGKQKESNRVDPSESNGMGTNEITDRKIYWKVKTYAALGTTMFTALETQVEGATSFQWGPTGKVIKVSAAYGQNTKITKGEENGVTTWEIEGQCNRNDLTISINPT